MEKLSNDIEKTINEIKVNFEKINQNKENLKEKIQNIFTKIRQILNEREDELLLEIDETYSNLYGNENIIKESWNLPYEINSSLKNGKIIDKDWKENQLSLMINNCINIENNIKDINNLLESFKKFNTKKEIKFTPDGDELNTFEESIKSFGNIWINNYSSLLIREYKKCSVTKFGGNIGCFGKLVGYRFSPTVQEVLHVIELTKAPIELLNVDWDDQKARKILVAKSPTRTFPFLEIEEGVLSESQTIEEYLATKYKVELLGQNEMQKAKVRQWIDFASFELDYCAKEIIHPIFGWKQYNKESADQANSKLKEFMRTLEKQINEKKYILGDKLTLADVSLFRHLKLFFQLVFSQGFRKYFIPKVSTWFTIVSQTPEVKKVYGKVLLCNQPVKAFISEKKPEKKKLKRRKKRRKERRKKEEKKKVNPLDLLPPSKLELETFKRAFLNNKDKEDAMKKFWEVYDPEGYSLWWLEYQNLPTECKVLFRTSNLKGMFLKKCDALRRYAFAVHGVYGVEDDYKIRGLWMFRGKEVPQEMKDNDLYEYTTFRKLDEKKEEDKKLVHDYWTKLNETDEVEGRKCADVKYFY